MNIQKAKTELKNVEKKKFSIHFRVWCRNFLKFLRKTKYFEVIHEFEIIISSLEGAISVGYLNKLVIIKKQTILHYFDTMDLTFQTKMVKNEHQNH